MLELTVIDSVGAAAVKVKVVVVESATYAIWKTAPGSAPPKLMVCSAATID